MKSGRVWRYLLFLLVVAASFYFLYLIREVVFSFLCGAILAYFLFRPVRLVEKRGIKRVWAIVFIYVLAAGVVGLLLWSAIPHLVREINSLAKLIPQYANQAQDVAQQINGINFPGKLEQIVRENTNKIENTVYNTLRGFIAGLYVIMSKALIIVFAPILAFYILKDWERIRDCFLNILSPGIRRDVTFLAEETDSVLIEFIKGHFLVSVLVGTLSGFAAAVIGVRFAWLIGIVSGVTNLVPYFGPILGGIPATALALSESLRTGIYMAVAIIIIQQVESNVITPKIIGDRLGMHPLFIVFSLLAGGKLLGIWGMLIAVPLAACLKIIGNYAYLKMLEQ